MQAETRHVWFQQTFLLIKIPQLQKKKTTPLSITAHTVSLPTAASITQKILDLANAVWRIRVETC
jgi:hypothetical protein